MKEKIKKICKSQNPDGTFIELKNGEWISFSNIDIAKLKNLCYGLKDVKILTIPVEERDFTPETYYEFSGEIPIVTNDGCDLKVLYKSDSNKDHYISLSLGEFKTLVCKQE